MIRNPLPPGTFLALLFSLLLLNASPGFAQEDDEDDSFGRPGWYLAGTAVGALTLHRDNVGSVDNSIGATGRVGYRANPVAAMEAEFEWIAPYEETLSGTVINDFRNYAIGLNGKFYFSESSIQPYAIAGVNVLIVSESAGGTKSRDSDWGFRGGAGVDFYVSPHVALNAEVSYMWGVGDVWRQDYLSFGVGAMYRF